MYIEPGTILYYHPISHVTNVSDRSAYTYWVVISKCGNSVNVYEISTGDTVWTSHNFLRNNFFKVRTHVSFYQRSSKV